MVAKSRDCPMKVGMSREPSPAIKLTLIKKLYEFGIRSDDINTIPVQNFEIHIFVKVWKNS